MGNTISWKNNLFHTKSWMRSEMIWKHIEQWQNNLTTDCLLAFCHLGTKTSWRKNTCFHPKQHTFPNSVSVKSTAEYPFYDTKPMWWNRRKQTGTKNTMNNWLAKKNMYISTKILQTKWPNDQQSSPRPFPQWAPWPHWQSFLCPTKQKQRPHRFLAFDERSMAKIRCSRSKMILWV